MECRSEVKGFNMRATCQAVTFGHLAHPDKQDTRLGGQTAFFCSRPRMGLERTTFDSPSAPTTRF